MSEWVMNRLGDFLLFYLSKKLIERNMLTDIQNLILISLTLYTDIHFNIIRLTHRVIIALFCNSSENW